MFRVSLSPTPYTLEVLFQILQVSLGCLDRSGGLFDRISARLQKAWLL